MKKVIVFGAGTMGSGIASWFATRKVQVELVDQSMEFCSSAKEKVFASWDKLQAKGKFSADEVITFKELFHLKDKNDISKDADLVVEAIFEDLQIKKELFSFLDETMDSKTVIASNTSSFPMKDLSSDLTKERKANFLGLHFFNPAPIMKLVEVISSPWTTPELATRLRDWFNQEGKKAALVSDSPGFIVNRVARNFYGEAFRIIETADEAKCQELDSVMREVGGFRMGPFELMDLIGIDVNYDVTCSVWSAYDEHPRFAPHAIQKQMVDEKRFGKKSGRGFYSYD